MKKAQITGIGFNVPERIVTNQDLEKIMDTNDQWIQERSGITQRHWVGEESNASILAIEAAKNAILDAKIDANDIDLVICATLTSDYFFPGISNQIQYALGMRKVGAFDIKAACSAFIYSLSIGDQFIRTEQCKTILVVGAEVQSTALDLSDEGRNISVLFADGAGAAILQATDSNKGILSTHLHSDGKFLKDLWCEAPGTSNNPRLTKDILDEGKHLPYMNGREVFKNAVRRFPEVINEALDANKLTIDDIVQIIPHQANHRISKAVAKRMGVGMDKVFSNIKNYGNTTAASIPIAMCDAREKGLFSSDDIIILAAFGAGFTWASTAIRW
ncbi:MAG: 3-oxoacyl-ACP synthase [Candidatus Marinimicrobia bacterium]|nr:3-oxoacyl-ACP synthase [Candidatus Neomarinimicrobiota bacterium]